jgi:hypothetical protein
MIFSFNPVNWYESAINARMERDAAITLLGAALSFWVSFLWGLSRLPLVGTAFSAAARSTYVALLHSRALDGLTLVVPHELAEPENQTGLTVTVFHR